VIAWSSVTSTRAPEPVGAFPHAKKVGGLLFLSGIGPRKRSFCHSAPSAMSVGPTSESPTARLIMFGPRTRVAPHTFDPSSEGTIPLPDNLITVNPSVVRRPADGMFLLYFKGNIYDPNWRGVHGVAIGDSPAGGFTPYDTFLFESELPDGTTAKNAEDPFVWFDHRRQRFYAIVKDFTGLIGGERSSLVLFTSLDGIDWAPARHPLVSRRRLVFEDGSTIEVQHLERPQLLLDSQGQPMVLYCACTPGNGYAVPGPTVNVQISLRGADTEY